MEATVKLTLLGEEGVLVLASDLGNPAYNVLQVAKSVGYRDPDQEQ